MIASSDNSSGIIGFIGLLTIVLIIFRLCNMITWSWWWVLSPIWILAAAVVAMLVIIGLIAVTMMVLKRKQ